MYDIGLDEFRDVTQRDVDLLQRAASNWGSTRQAIEQLAFVTGELHKKFMSHVSAISGNSGEVE